MARGRKTSAVERRLADLDKEQAILQADIKALGKALRDPASLRGRMRRKPEPPAVEASAAVVETPESAMRPASGLEAPAEEKGSRDLFTWRAGPRPAPQSAPSTAAPRPKPGRGRMDERLASYLTSGSFMPTALPPPKPSIQRNKAIFMIVFVVVVTFIIFKAAFRF